MTRPKAFDLALDELRHEGAQAERAAIVAYMRDAITQGYPSDRPDKALCSHGTFSDEDCIGCYDEFLSAKLDAVESGDHLKDRPS